MQAVRLRTLKMPCRVTVVLFRATPRDLIPNARVLAPTTRNSPSARDPPTSTPRNILFRLFHNIRQGFSSSSVTAAHQSEFPDALRGAVEMESRSNGQRCTRYKKTRTLRCWRHPKGSTESTECENTRDTRACCEAASERASLAIRRCPSTLGRRPARNM